MSMIEKMTREQLIIAAFFVTPLKHRFMFKAPDSDDPIEIAKVMMYKTVPLFAFSDDGLRAVVNYWDAVGNNRMDALEVEAVANKLRAAEAEAIRTMASEARA